MTANELCPKHGCGWRGTPLENLSVQPLYNLSEHHFECCLWHESKVKCRRTPRFSGDPEAEDYLDLLTRDEFESAGFEKQ